MITLNHEEEKLLDRVGWQILYELQCDARIPMSELGRRVGLSSPAVAERVRRMEEAGIIKGYRTEIDLGAMGWTMQAVVRVQTYSSQFEKILAMMEQTLEVIECHCITGEDCYVMRVAFADVSHLEQLVEKFRPYGRLTSSIILSSPVPPSSRIIAPPD